MQFPRRTWSTWVVQRIRMPVSPREASVLVDQLTWAARQDTKWKNGTRLTPAHSVIYWSCMLCRDIGAVRRLANELGISTSRAQGLLEGVSTAARKLASEKAMDELFKVIDRK